MPSNSKIFGVIGKPILHSLSPEIFSFLCGQYDIDAYYSRISAKSAGECIEFCKNHQISGINITSPFKTDVIPFCSKLSEDAISANSVNTMRFGAENEGFNSDIAALRTIIGKLNHPKNALILGAGSASNSIALVLKENSIPFAIANRTKENADAIALKFEAESLNLEEAIETISTFDLIINLLPGDLDLFDSIVLNNSQIVVDAIYNNPKLEAIAEKSGANYISGLEWLIRQALVSFKLFTGIMPAESAYEDIYGHIKSIVKKKTDRIAIIGFMGAGKSTIGKKLAEKLGYSFYDLDNIIEADGRSIKEIFEKEGEGAFRKLESQNLSEYINADSTEKSILACGGGIIESDENIELLSQFDCVIYLYASLEDCRARTGNSPERPLASDATQFKHLYESRLQRYYKACDLAFVNNSDAVAAVNALTIEIKRLSRV